MLQLAVDEGAWVALMMTVELGRMLKLRSPDADLH